MPVGMTDKEREVLELIVKYGSLKQACISEGRSMNTLNQRLVRIRIKAEKYRLWLKEYERLKLQLPTRYLE
jgi:hypothetical protein